jgi:hypothetical protein
MKRSASTLLDPAPPETPLKANVASWYAPGLSDGLGDRLLMFDNTSSSPLELLRFRPELGEQAAFEDALRKRVRDLERLRHPAIARVRAVEWLGNGEGLALISNHVAGRRLSEVLARADVGLGAQGSGLALSLIRQLTPALAALQEHGGGIAHGVLTPERIVIAPDGHLVLVEHVLGSALNAVGWSARRLQVELGLALPGAARFVSLDRGTDVTQLAFVALSILLGRRLDSSDYPDRIERLLDETGRSAGHGAALPRLRGWLARAFQLEGDPFESALDAHDALTDLIETTSQRRFVSMSGSHDLAGAMATMTTTRQHLATTDAPDAPPVTQVWPVPVPLGETPRPLALPKPAAGPRRIGRGARWAIGILAVFVLAQAGIITGLMLRRSADGPTDATPTAAGPPSTSAPVQTSTAALLQPNPAAVEPVAPPPAIPSAPPVASIAPSGLEITSDPPGARVTINGERRGVTPLTLTMAPGQYAVAVSDGRTTVTRSVTVPSGGTATFTAAMAPAGASAGWVTITSPVELQVQEDGALLGTTKAARLMLPAGRHSLELSNTAVGFQTSVVVDIQPGKTATTSVTVPNGSLSVNALPWANVFVDGRPVGTTPVANLELPLGTHEVIWRHPQLGERRQTVVVTLTAPLRLVMDLSK